MRHKFVIASTLMVGLGLGLQACGNTGSDNSNNNAQTEEVVVNPDDQPAEEVDEPFGYQKVSIERRNKKGKCTIEVDYPKAGNEELQKNIKEFINSEMGDMYEGDLNKAEAMLEFYALQRLDEFQQEIEMQKEVTVDIKIKVDEDTDNRVTYSLHFYSHTQGLQPHDQKYGATFNKKDGKLFGWDQMVNTESNEFKQLLKEGLKTYFKKKKEEVSDSDLKNALLNIDNVDNLPRPQGNPYICQKGMVVFYKLYEIAPQAAGQPTVVLPFSTAKKFIGKDAQNILK